MNKDQQTPSPEEKLREAAIEVLKKDVLKQSCTDEDEFDEQMKEGYYDLSIEAFLELAKSHAAKEYHQSMQPKVNLDKIAMKIVNKILEESGVSVEKRQSINDTCDQFVKEVISSFMQPKVDVEDLKIAYADFTQGWVAERNIWDIFSWFLPYLQPKSDAVEFGKFLQAHCKLIDSLPMNEWNYMSWKDNYTKQRLTTEELYTKYQQSKTK